MQFYPWWVIIFKSRTWRKQYSCIHCWERLHVIECYLNYYIVCTILHDYRYMFYFFLSQISNSNHFRPQLFVLLQTETETLAGHYCDATPFFLTSYWYPVATGASFALWFLIPINLIVHNYARIGRTLFKSLKENLEQKEGTVTHWVDKLSL